MIYIYFFFKFPYDTFVIVHIFYPSECEWTAEEMATPTEGEDRAIPFEDSDAEMEVDLNRPFDENEDVVDPSRTKLFSKNRRGRLIDNVDQELLEPSELVQLQVESAVPGKCNY